VNRYRSIEHKLGENLDKIRRWRVFLIIAFFVLIALLFVVLNPRFKSSSPLAKIETRNDIKSPRAITIKDSQSRTVFPNGVLSNLESAYHSVLEFGNQSNMVSHEHGIIVRVFSPERFAITDATIRVYKTYDPDSEGFKDLITQSFTDQSGSCRMSLDDSVRSCSIAVTKRGYDSLHAEVEFQEPGFVERNYVLREAPASVQGHVMDSEGQPIPGAVVSTWFGLSAEETHETELSSITDRLGRYEISSLPEGLVPLLYRAS
jgi:hypothetical protein